MRIVTYNGLPVKRQKKIGHNEIKVVFYDDNPPIVVTVREWQKNSQNKYFDDPKARRCEIVHRPALVR